MMTIKIGDVDTRTHTPRVPAWLAFVLRLLLVLAVSALAVGFVAVSLESERAWIRWQASR